MRYRSTHRLSHTLDSIALTDIIMNLFIFFFITFSLAYIPKTQSAVKVELPRAGRGETIASGPLVFSLRREESGRVWLGETAYEEAALVSALRALPPEQITRGAILRCDRDVPIERALRALDLFREAGITQVSVAAQPESSTGP